MQARVLSVFIVFVAAVLIGGAFVQSQTAQVYAAPVRAITPSPEPPTPQPTASPTALPTAPPASPTLPPGTALPTVPPPATTTPVANTPQPTTTPGPNSPSVPGSPEITIVKTTSQASATVGDQVTFTLTVSNQGSGDADNVVASDNLPNGFDFVQATSSRGSVTVIGRGVTVSIGTLRPGEVVTITLVTTINAAAQSGQVSNTALVNTNTPGDNPNNNTSTVTVDLTVPVAVATPSTSPDVPTAAPSVPTAPSNLPKTLPKTGASESYGMVAAIVGAGLLILGLALGFRRAGHRRG